MQNNQANINNEAKSKKMSPVVKIVIGLAELSVSLPLFLSSVNYAYSKSEQRYYYTYEDDNVYAGVQKEQFGINDLICATGYGLATVTAVGITMSGFLDLAYECFNNDHTE